VRERTSVGTIFVKRVFSEVEVRKRAAADRKIITSDTVIRSR
jgi:hypothetical protein